MSIWGGESEGSERQHMPQAINILTHQRGISGSKKRIIFLVIDNIEMGCSQPNAQQF